jgi:hypothetical protein
LFRQWEARGREFLAIAGPYEFLVDDPFRHGFLAPKGDQGSFPPDKLARIALAAHNYLRVNLGWLSPAAARWMLEAAGSIPVNFTVVESRPVARLLPSKAGNIGVVLFPQGPEPGRGPTPEQERAVIAAGKTLRGKARLVLGVSPWGYFGERRFLPKAAGVFHCILGGGEGVGFGDALSEDGSVLWLRPDSKGRAVNIVEFYALPPESGPVRWREKDNYKAVLEFLDDSCPSDPGMEAILGKAGKKK